jgi:hypothetical protein
MVEQCRVAQKEKDDLQSKFEEERAQFKQEKEQLLVEQLGVKEAVDIDTSLYDGLRAKGRRPSGSSSSVARESYLVASTNNNRLRSTNNAQHSAGCGRSKRRNCSKCS